MSKIFHLAMIGDFPRSDREVGGGVESVMLYLSRELIRHPAIQLDIVTMDRWGLGERNLDLDGFRVHYIGQSSLPSRLGMAQNISNMRNALQRLSPDLVHAHIAGYYSDAARLSGLPWILTLHGIRFLEARLRHGWLNQVYRRRVVEKEEQRGVRSAPYIISINPFVREAFTGQISGQLFDIENPVDNQFFDLPQINKPFSILYAGRLTPRKDLMTLLQAFRLVLDKEPRARLRLAGACDANDPDNYCEQLRAFVDDQGMADNVDFLGQIKNEQLLQEYSEASIAVLAAVLETAPMAITEAMASATAVVTTDAGGCRHLVTPGETGEVVTCRAPEALANALLNTFGPDGRALEMGVQGRAAAEIRFSGKNVASRTLAAYSIAAERSDLSDFSAKMPTDAR